MRARVGGPILALTVALTFMVGVPRSALAGPVSEVTARIRELEAQGRAHPREAADALERMLASTGEFSTERLELLTVEGVTLAVASMDQDAERAAVRLDAWSRDPTRPHAAAAGSAALLVRARTLIRGGSLKQADMLLREAIGRLPADMPPVDRYRFVFADGYVANEAGRLEDAVRLMHEALALADRQDDLWRQSEARTALVSSYYSAKQYERARSLAAEAVSLSTQAHDDVSLGRAHNAEGIAADGMNDLPGERRAFEAAIECARRAGSKIDEVRYLANLSDFFLKTADYKTALSYAERALPLTRELGDHNSENVALSNIGLAQISLHHIEIGMRNVRDALAIDERRGSATGVASLWREVGLYLERAGDQAGSIAAYHQHRRLITGILRDDQQKVILAMQEQYDADNRTRALTLLNRESAIKAEQLHRRDLQQMLWVLLAVVSVMSFAIVALLYRRVRQTNRLLTRSNEMLKLQGERDPLTGLANRRHFQAVMRQLAHDGTLSGTVYLIDIDHFKRVNDHHGHSAGDAVLVEASRRLRETMREEDLIVRWGGEEFLVVVQRLAADQVEALAQRMLSALDHRPIAVGEQRISITGSIGFATFPIGPGALRVSWERAIELVDTAMYLAKAHGRNRAYGVALPEARDEASFEAVTRGLESACRDGRATLTLLQGRQPLAAAA